MKIDDRNGVAGTTSARTADVESAQAAAKTKGSSTYSSRSGGDSVELSGVSRSVHHFEAARGARIAQLSKAVQSGSYSVSASSVGKALVSETLAGGGLSSK